MTPETLADVKVAFEYFSDYSGKLTEVQVGFFILVGFGLILTVIRFYSYTLRNPIAQFLNDYRTQYARKFLYYLFDIEAELMYWVIFCATVLVLLNYKT